MAITNFKKGDEVICLDEQDGWEIKGVRGTLLTDYDEDAKPSRSVPVQLYKKDLLAKGVYGIDGHDCGGRGEYGLCWNIEIDNLNKVIVRTDGYINLDY